MDDKGRNVLVSLKVCQMKNSVCSDSVAWAILANLEARKAGRVDFCVLTNL